MNLTLSAARGHKSALSSRIAVSIAFAVSCLASAAYSISSNVQFQIPNPAYGPSDSLSCLFGSSLASTGKFLLVGAPKFDHYSVADTGQVMIFWQKTGSYAGFFDFEGNHATADLIGSALAANTKHIAIGAPGTVVSAFADAGRVYIRRSDFSDPLRMINNPSPEAGEKFGTSVALLKDLVVIGAPKDDEPGGVIDCGATYIVNLAVSDVPVPLEDPAAMTGDLMGQAVAISSNYIVVGCPGRQVGGYNSAGAIVVFDARTFAYVRTINNPFPHTNDKFGSSVTASKTVVAGGAPYAEFNTGLTTLAAAGAVYQFNAETGVYLREFRSPYAQTDAHFGASISTDGKILAAGAADEDYTGTNEGAAYVFNWKTGVYMRANLSENLVDHGTFGSSVLVMKGSRYVVGAAGEPTTIPGGGTISGAGYAYMYFKPLRPR